MSTSSITSSISEFRELAEAVGALPRQIDASIRRAANRAIKATHKAMGRELAAEAGMPASKFVKARQRVKTMTSRDMRAAWFAGLNPMEAGRMSPRQSKTGVSVRAGGKGRASAPHAFMPRSKTRGQIKSVFVREKFAGGVGAQFSTRTEDAGRKSDTWASSRGLRRISVLWATSSTASAGESKAVKLTADRIERDMQRELRYLTLDAQKRNGAG